MTISIWERLSLDKFGQLNYHSAVQFRLPFPVEIQSFWIFMFIQQQHLTDFKTQGVMLFECAA
jgi:hypothetical protein